MSVSLNSFDLLGEMSRRRVKRAAQAPVWPVVHRGPARPVETTPSMDAPVWRGATPAAETPVPPVPAHLRSATIAPDLALQERLMLPPERLEGPAELEFEGFDADWFREGTMETAPPREVDPHPLPAPAPTWLLAIPVLAGGIMLGMGAMMLLWNLFAG